MNSSVRAELRSGRGWAKPIIGPVPTSSACPGLKPSRAQLPFTRRRFMSWVMRQATSRALIVICAVALAKSIGLERSLVGEVGMIAEELQAVGVVRGDQHLQHQAAEQPRQHLHRQEVVGTAADPTCAVERY